MFKKKILIILFSFLFYQSALFSKSNSFEKIDARTLSKYFSGIVAFENKNNSEALDFFKSSKILTNQHTPFLQKFVKSLVLEGNISQAINAIRTNSQNENSNFYEAYILLVLDNLKKNNINKAKEILISIPESLQRDRFKFIILKTLEQYVDVFLNNEIQIGNQKFGTLSFISETFQRCFLNDEKVDTFFLKLINKVDSDYSRYVYFYLSYLIENNRIEEAKIITDDLDYINTTLLLSQGKSWIDKNEFNKFSKVFSCNNHNDVMAEFLFLISNLYSSQNEFENSNFYLNLSNFLNPKFVFNLSLVAENFYLNKDYEKSKSILKIFNKDQDFYYWYRSKKEAQIISKTSNKKEGLNYIKFKFAEIINPNNKFIFDIANFYKNAKEYDLAIEHYSKIIDTLKVDDEVKADLLYRRGASFERSKDYFNADTDLQYSLTIDPNNAYVLNYLAYSWLERDYKINEAIKMLEKAYEQENDDPYIIDSIGWAYYLVDDFVKAEKFLKRAVELMPDDPIVNDHYGDILWKLNRKIQARYFWSAVLDMDDTDKELIDQIKNKLINGLNNS